MLYSAHFHIFVTLISLHFVCSDCALETLMWESTCFFKSYPLVSTSEHISHLKTPDLCTTLRCVLRLDLSAKLVVHIKQACGLFPVWVLMWASNLVVFSLANNFWQYGHFMMRGFGCAWSCSKCWDLICRKTACVPLNLSLQYLHEIRIPPFIPCCLVLWQYRVDRRRNDISHISHLNSVSFVWVFRWLLRPPLSLNILPQMLQVNLFASWSGLCFLFM